jgi:hypothetical protein
VVVVATLASYLGATVGLELATEYSTVLYVAVARVLRTSHSMYCTVVLEYSY